MQLVYKLSFALCVSLPLLPSLARAEVRTISTRAETRPSDPSCGTSQTCDLKRVKFVEYKKEVRFPGEDAKYASHLTDVRFALTLDSADSIESYGVVQYIRGCMYESFFRNGREMKSMTIQRDHFGRTVPFQHKEWEIDTDSADPLYSSYPGVSRFALLRWNQDPDSLDPETATYYADKKSPHGSVFLTDLPGSASLSPDDLSARNASLEFRTCVFRLADLPLSTDPRGSNIDRNKALWCVNWDHKYTWDAKSKRIRQSKTIDPFCEVR